MVNSKRMDKQNEFVIEDHIFHNHVNEIPKHL